MKFLILTFIPLVSFAQEVKIDSFTFLGPHSSAAEICGTVQKLTGQPNMIKLSVDPRSKNPATYYAWSGKDGKFCSVVSTLTGEANANLESVK
jgi:hypothetical protein